MTEWEKVGLVCIDAGVCMIVDPCRVLHRGQRTFQGHAMDPPYSEFGESWNDFCNKTDAIHGGIPIHGGTPETAPPGFVQVGQALAVVTSTGFGDGVYPVFVKRSEDGRIAAVKIEFIEEEPK